MKLIYEAVTVGFVSAGCVAITDDYLSSGTLQWWAMFILMVLFAHFCFYKQRGPN